MQPFSPSLLKITYPPLSPVSRTLAPSFSPPIIQAHLDTLPNAEAGPSRHGSDLGVPSLPARPRTPRVILRVDQPTSSSAPLAESGHSAITKEQSLVLDRVLKLGSQRVRPNALFCAWNGCTAELATPDILSKHLARHCRPRPGSALTDDHEGGEGLVPAAIGFPCEWRRCRNEFQTEEELRGHLLGVHAAEVVGHWCPFRGCPAPRLRATPDVQGHFEVYHPKPWTLDQLNQTPHPLRPVATPLPPPLPSIVPSYLVSPGRVVSSHVEQVNAAGMSRSRSNTSNRSEMRLSDLGDPIVPDRPDDVPFWPMQGDAPIGYLTGSSSLYLHPCPKYVPNRERDLRRIIKSTGNIAQVTVAARTIRGRESGQKAKVDIVVMREQVPFRLIPRPTLPRTPVLGTSVDFLPQDKRLLPRTKLLRLTSEGTGGTQAQWRRRSKGKGKAIEAETLGAGEDLDMDSAQFNHFTQNKIERAAKRVATKAVGISIGMEHLVETTAFIEDGRLLGEIEMEGERSE